MVLTYIKGMLEKCFEEKALGADQQIALENEIKMTSQRLGFDFIGIHNDMRIFHREMDDAKATINKVGCLTTADQLRMHEFDGGL